MVKVKQIANIIMDKKLIMLKFKQVKICNFMELIINFMELIVNFIQDFIRSLMEFQCLAYVKQRPFKYL